MCREFPIDGTVGCVVEGCGRRTRAKTGLRFARSCRDRKSDSGSEEELRARYAAQLESYGSLLCDVDGK